MKVYQIRSQKTSPVEVLCGVYESVEAICNCFPYPGTIMDVDNSHVLLKHNNNETERFEIIVSDIIKPQNSRYKAYQAGGINWCWWIVTEEREDGVHLVGHFRERWGWVPNIPYISGKLVEADGLRAAVGICTSGYWTGMKKEDCQIQFVEPMYVFHPCLEQCNLVGERP